MDGFDRGAYLDLNAARFLGFRAVPYLVAVKIFPVGKGQDRQAVARFFAYQVSDAVVCIFAVEHSTQPDVNITVRIVLTIPNPTVEVRIGCGKLVVRLARRPGIGRLKPSATGITQSARDEPVQPERGGTRPIPS